MYQMLSALQLCEVFIRRNAGYYRAQGAKNVSLHHEGFCQNIDYSSVSYEKIKCSTVLYGDKTGVLPLFPI